MALNLAELDRLERDSAEAWKKYAFYDGKPGHIPSEPLKHAAVFQLRPLLTLVAQQHKAVEITLGFCTMKGQPSEELAEDVEKAVRAAHAAYEEAQGE